MPDDGLRIEYVEARRVLLDVLTALTPHLDALVLVGAQAVYLRTVGRIETYQPFTTDADVVLDPNLLGPIPPLGQAMERAGFRLTDEPGIWEAHLTRPGFSEEIVVPVDLIVPEELAPRAGRRSARLPANTARQPPARAPASPAPSLTTPPLSSPRSRYRMWALLRLSSLLVKTMTRLQKSFVLLWLSSRPGRSSVSPT